LLRFFKVNDPYRLLFLLVLLFLFRLPFYWGGIDTLLPDLHHMLIGERLAKGNVLYKDLWVNIGPLSAGFFTVMHWLFGKSIAAYHVIGFLLMFVQAMLFNRLALVNKIYTENNYVPAVIYAVLMSVSVDMFAVSPIMFSVTFILLAMNNIFGQVEFRVKRDEKILNIGIYLGIAALFYFPTILFGIIGVLGLALFSATILRRYLLILYGLLLPFLLIGGYYFLIGNTQDSLTIFFNSWLGETDYQLDKSAVLALCIVPMLFLLLSIFRVLQGARFSNYQARIAQMMLLWIALSLLLLIRPMTGVNDLMIFIPPVAYFVTHFFILSRKKMLSGISFIVFIVSIVGISYCAYFEYLGVSKFISYEPLSIQKSRYENLLRGKKIWVIGNNLSLYKNSQLASQFYNWDTYGEQFMQDELNSSQVALVFKDLTVNSPDVIVDPHGVIPAYFPFMPTVSRQYEMLEKGIYLRKGFKLEEE